MIAECQAMYQNILHTRLVPPPLFKKPLILMTKIVLKNVGSFSIQSSLTQVQLLQILGSYESHDFDPTQLDKFPCILFQFSRYSLQMSAARIQLLHSWLPIDSLTQAHLL